MAFQPGQSGNPSGRPKESPELKAAARQWTEQAIQVLADALSDEKTQNRIMAANALLDRGYGKPGQSVDLGNKDDKAFLVDQIVRRIVDPAN